MVSALSRRCACASFLGSLLPLILWAIAGPPTAASFSASDSLNVADIDEHLTGLSADSTVTDADGRLLLDLLALAGEPLPEEDLQIVKRHVARVVPLLPDSLKDRIASPRHRENTSRWELQAEAGSLLLAWWRSQDPMPATDRNERVDEHLKRVAYALENFEAETPAGYDDRGEIYVRLGEPFQRRSISFSDGRLIREVFRFGVPVTPSDFPDNEIWTYPHIHRNIFYIFVSDRKKYRIGNSEDLLPKSLRVQTASSERSMNIAASSLAAMRYILERLALLHSDFGSRYAAVDNYALWQEERRMSRGAGAPLTPGEREVVVGTGFTSVAVYSNPLLSIESINEFVRASITETRILDRHSMLAREESVPAVYSDVLSDFSIDEIPIAMRASRFLAEDGSTQTIVDWAPAPGALNLDRRRREALEKSGHDQYEDAVLYATVVQEDESFEAMSVEQDTFALLSPGAENSVITPQTIRLPEVEPGSKLALQLDRYVAHVRQGPPMRVLMGPQIQIGLQRSDRLRPLDTNPAHIEMSDLRPMFTLFTASALAASEDPLAQTQPFPFTFAPSQGSLVLQFEIYNLTFDGDDRTRYSIEYEVARRDPERGLLGILGRSKMERTAARTEHEGGARRVEEYIVLDPGEWTTDSDLVLTVRVNDEVAGQTAERSLTFGG